MHLYYVTYDYLIKGRYYEHGKRFFAENAKAACQQIKTYHEERRVTLLEQGYSRSAVRELVHHPFHIKAQRLAVEEDPA